MRYWLVRIFLPWRRIRFLERELRRLETAIHCLNDHINGTPEEGWRDSRPPHGDDYNELFGEIEYTLDRTIR